VRCFTTLAGGYVPYLRLYLFERGRNVTRTGAIDFSLPSHEADGTEIRLEQLASLADQLVEQVGTVRGHYEQLQRTLDEELPEQESTVGGAAPVEAAYTDQPEDPEGPQVHDSARLVVMEMAVTGSTREETKDYLRTTLGVLDGDPIVDEVFDRTEAAQEQVPVHRRLFARRRD
jgi:hypothetical protein